MDSLESSETSASASAATEASATQEATPAEGASAVPSESESASVSTDTASATTDPNASPATDAGLATADPMYATVSVLGTLVAVDTEQDMFTIQEGTGDAAPTADANGTPVGQIVAVEAEDCMIVDCQTGAEVDDDQLRVGDRVFAFVSPNQTRSIPPQAQCYALVTNLPENDMGIASYVHATQVEQGADGGVQVLNQNADLWVTIPGDLKIEVFDEPNETATAASIRPGSNLIVWYDMVAESYPAQTTATRVMLDD